MSPQSVTYLKALMGTTNIMDLATKSQRTTKTSSICPKDFPPIRPKTTKVNYKAQNIQPSFDTSGFNLVTANSQPRLAAIDDPQKEYHKSRAAGALCICTSNQAKCVLISSEHLLAPKHCFPEINTTYTLYFPTSKSFLKAQLLLESKSNLDYCILKLSNPTSIASAAFQAEIAIESASQISIQYRKLVEQTFTEMQSTYQSTASFMEGLDCETLSKKGDCGAIRVDDATGCVYALHIGKTKSPEGQSKQPTAIKIVDIIAEIERNYPLLALAWIQGLRSPESWRTQISTAVLGTESVELERGEGFPAHINRLFSTLNNIAELTEILSIHSTNSNQKKSGKANLDNKTSKKSKDHDIHKTGKPVLEKPKIIHSKHTWKIDSPISEYTEFIKKMRETAADCYQNNCFGFTFTIKFKASEDHNEKRYQSIQFVINTQDNELLYLVGMKTKEITNPWRSFTNSTYANKRSLEFNFNTLISSLHKIFTWSPKKGNIGYIPQTSIQNEVDTSKDNRENQLIQVAFFVSEAMRFEAVLIECETCIKNPNNSIDWKSFQEGLLTKWEEIVMKRKKENSSDKNKKKFGNLASVTLEESQPYGPKI